MELRDITNDLFLFVATFRERIERGQKPPLAQLSREVKNIFINMDTRARSEAVLSARYDKLRYGLAALVDEIVVSSDWADASNWPVLELEFYNSNIAGNYVYELIASLTPADPDLVEGYFFILAMGFRGQYAFEEAKWAETLQRLYVQIPGKAFKSDLKLAPEAYRVIKRQSQKLDPLFSLVRSIMIFVISLIVIFVFYQVVWSSLLSDARAKSREVIQYVSDDGLRQSLSGADE